MSSANATAARKRRQLNEARIAAARDGRQKRWQALAWVAAEAGAFLDVDEAVAALVEVAVEMNGRNAERRRR